jgi:CheY-like chemotaxis protein
LTLVRTLVGLHGGSVEAHSDGAGHGTQFIVRLPSASPAAPVKPRRSDGRRQTAETRGMRVLVVDDNRDAAAMLAEAMDAFGYEAQVASDGPTALETAARFNPHAVLLDLGLPVMDGYEVADRLRAAGISVPLLAVTGYGQEADRARSETSGFVAHFVKPVDLEELKHSLDRLLAGPTSTQV